ncbi:AMP-binding protein [uncultured Hyphomicrobium sp.]|uniref:class I adenylate-forming enzyme family protein n=1 Tax=uncultured Hyphomicrobium sp. TaxID=194373 RepID=UPI0025D7A4CB|nr:AMP-binding protein [uncultured Hyphomicrobium sp.]
MRVEHFLSQSARRSPDKVALVAAGKRWTYAQLDAAADRLATSLAARGLKHGERVVVFMDNSAEAVIAIFAALKAGAVFSPVNPTTKANKLAYILNNCRAAAILTEARHTGVVAQATADAPTVRITVVAGDARGESLPGSLSFEAALADTAPDVTPPRAATDVDLAMLVYTSGSTGQPKGVMMLHRNVVAAATSITTYLESRADDIVMSVLPISFDYGLYQVLMTFKVGATLVLERSFAFPMAILKQMAEERVTGFPLVPTMASMLLNMKGVDLSALADLRYITNTAAALPVAHIQRMQELFPGTRIFSMYGLTECKRCTYLPPDQLPIRPGSVGIAIPNTEAYVVNASGERTAPGEVGELVIRGPHVMQGYWENPEATAKALRPGLYPWEHVLYTGDLFRTDEEGYLYFVGRQDDIIKSRGEKVAPKEVESVLYALRGVREAVVLGVPDPVLGEAIKAVVACDPAVGLTEKDILRHCAAHLEDYMLPKIVEIRTELPKSDNGKLSRRLVAAEHE